jgi:3'-5' exoribonuclease
MNTLKNMLEVSSLKDGDLVEVQLAIRSKNGFGEGLKDYSNKPGRFFVLRVGNSTGDVTLKYWGGKNPDPATKLFTSFNVGDVIFVKGRCTHDSYSKGLVISVNEEAKYGFPKDLLKKAAKGEYRSEDFLPALPMEVIESSLLKLISFISGVENQYLKELLKGFFEEKSFIDVFKKTPAARRHHHNYIGGLLEHSINVARLCETICDFYPLDKDLLISAALLHDIGKTKEYTAKASIDVTDEGRLLGHLFLTAQMVEKKIETIESFPGSTKDKIIHMLLSHHGELEKGSPKVPAFPEAMALFHADYMDAFVKNTIQEIEGAGEELDWIFSRSLGRFLFKSSG